MLKTLLIDDEEPARFHLREMLSAHPEVKVVGEAAALAPARKLIARTPFDLLFLDVKLGPDTGFELIPDLPPDKPVIFVTGFEQHARRAFEVNAVDYLVKPVRAERLAESLQRVSDETHRSRARRPPEAPADPSYRLTRDDTVVLNSGNRARLARVSDISLIVAHENYSFVHCADGRQTLVRRSLKSWAGSLPTDDFVRIHRTMLVNLSHVLGYDRLSARHIGLRVSGVTLPVVASREATPEVITRIQSRFPIA